MNVKKFYVEIEQNGGEYQVG